MKIKIEILKIRCNRTSIELTPDEIYFAIFVASAKIVGNQIYPAGGDSGLFGQVSEVRSNVKKETTWRPQLNDIEIDIEDAEALAISFALYEKDDGTIYNELKEKATGAISSGTIEWPDVDIPSSIPQNNSDWISLAITLLKVVTSLVKHMRKDDLISQKDFHTNVDAISNFPRELRLEGGRGKYDVTILLSKIN